MAEILTAAQRVVLARHIARPGTADFIAALFTDFFEQKGDRQNREDPSILGGIALYKGAEICRSFSENTDDVKWTQVPKEARQIKTSVVRTAPFRRRRFGHVCPISYEKLYLFNRRLPGRGKIQVK